MNRRRQLLGLSETARAWIVLAAACGAVPLTPVRALGDGFSSQRAGFSVNLKGEICPYREMGIYVLPDEEISLKVVASKKAGDYRARVDEGVLEQLAPGQWRWRAPKEHGLLRFCIHQADRADSIVFNVFVMVPASELKEEHLNGYRIGSYPAAGFKGLKIYDPPRGFVEVTAENRGTLIAPHFRIEQFLSKQSSGYPKYVVLKERLLNKLEVILEQANEQGYACSTFHIMSGYRTPYYNKAIGNVKYSRHVYGGAADIFIDENPRDGMMDDLNGDGKSDYRDAGILYDIIDDMYGNDWYEPFAGGLGRYRKTAAHGPFVHVDVRGFRARWGD